MKPDSTDNPQSRLAAGYTSFADSARDEFPEGAAEFTDEVSRRRFLTIMGASAALAGAAGCIRPAPARKIVPYSVQPDQITPGVPLYFASAFPLGGYGTGILVRSNEGRPTKIEGNPDHPSSAGGAGVYALGSLLDLYDPDRSKNPTQNGLATTYDAVIDALREQLYDSSVLPPRPRPTKLRILTGTITSPTLASMIGRLLADFPDARWAQYDAVGREGVRGGARKAFGAPRTITYDFTKADVVLALDADFLAGMPGSERYSRDFGDRRKIRQDGKTLKEIHEGKAEKKAEKKADEHATKEGVQPDALNRLYAVECMPSCAGSVADHRLALPSSQIESFARALAAELGVAGAPTAGTLPDSARAWIKPLAADLKKAQGKSIVIAGDHQPASLHALVHAINNHLQNFNQTVFVRAPIEAPHSEEEGKQDKKDAAGARVIDLKTLTDELNRKEVDVLLIFGVNAVYTASADIKFGEALDVARTGGSNGDGRKTFTLYLGTHIDETAVRCEWHLNEAHYLETWGDIRGHDGTAAIQQPLIAPLYRGKSAIEFLAAIAPPAKESQEPKDPKGKKGSATPPSQPREGLDIVRAYWRDWFIRGKWEGEFEVFWQEAVRAGVVAESAAAVEEKVSLQGNWAADAPAAASGRGLELNFRLDPTIHDGRFANNGWLQELPKPITKMTWDNAAYMSEKTARDLDLPEVVYRWTGGEHGRSEVPVVELKISVGGEEKKVKAPVWVLPGHADGAVTVHLGYGRTRAGRVNATPDEPNAAGEAVRGFDANTLRSWVNGAPASFVSGLGVTNAESNYFLACVQAHASMVQIDPLSGHEWDRKPVRHSTLEHYKKEPGFAKVPPIAAGESELINENVPAPVEPSDPDPRSGTQGRHGTELPGGELHKNGKTGHKTHALTMYYPNDALAPELRPEQTRRWAMAIDMNACTGCSACVVACVGENNIPVVGKHEVTRGRAMHWINVDRYYTGDSANPTTLLQPRMCVQCEKAPCEIVCPVGATVHSTDGLNDMTYNRCVGTRYCSNNCPYKVRRFNFLTFADWDTDTLKLGRNPDVSVRSRGVMEKCTFCVQRIRGAEIVAEREHRPMRDGEIVTACQAACPSGAIVFGDLNDGHSVVAAWKREPRNYGLLAELNTMPRLTHLAIVRNPNPDMPK